MKYLLFIFSLLFLGISGTPRVLSWTPPVTATNGQPITIADLSGYRLYVRKLQSSPWIKTPAAIPAETPTWTVYGIPGTKLLYAVTAIGTNGKESAMSNELEVRF